MTKSTNDIGHFWSLIQFLVFVGVLFIEYGCFFIVHFILHVLLILITISLHVENLYIKSTNQKKNKQKEGKRNQKWVCIIVRIHMAIS